ncbi:MAG: hypothetical protein L6R38_009265, partial [Xanthoria sp. 2 TBL-2021]
MAAAHDKTPIEDTIHVLPARPSDLLSLETIVARSFHPGNPYVQSALPDTPTMRGWWRTVFQGEIENPACYPLIAVNTPSNEVVGFLCLRYMHMHPAEEEKAGGFWTEHPWTEDHDEGKWRFVIDCLVHWEEEVMRGNGKGAGYLHLELMGVEQAYQGRDVGRA